MKRYLAVAAVIAAVGLWSGTARADDHRRERQAAYSLSHHPHDDFPHIYYYVNPNYPGADNSPCGPPSFYWPGYFSGLPLYYGPYGVFPYCTYCPQYPLPLYYRNGW